MNNLYKTLSLAFESGIMINVLWDKQIDSETCTIKRIISKSHDLVNLYTFGFRQISHFLNETIAQLYFPLHKFNPALNSFSLQSSKLLSTAVSFKLCSGMWASMSQPKLTAMCCTVSNLWSKCCPLTARSLVEILASDRVLDFSYFLVPMLI